MSLHNDNTKGPKSNPKLNIVPNPETITVDQRQNNKYEYGLMLEKKFNHYDKKQDAKCRKIISRLLTTEEKLADYINDNESAISELKYVVDMLSRELSSCGKDLENIFEMLEKTKSNPSPVQNNKPSKGKYVVYKYENTSDKPVEIMSCTSKQDIANRLKINERTVTKLVNQIPNKYTNTYLIETK